MSENKKEIQCPICKGTHSVDMIKVSSIDDCTVIVSCLNVAQGSVYWDRDELLKLVESTREDRRYRNDTFKINIQNPFKFLWQKIRGSKDEGR